MYRGKTLGSEPSKYQQEEKSREIPPVAASEKGRAQTVCRDMYGVVGDIQSASSCSEKTEGQANGMGSPAREGESPVAEGRKTAWNMILSTAGHEESCRKQGGPPSKAKYSAATDSA